MGRGPGRASLSPVSPSQLSPPGILGVLKFASLVGLGTLSNGRCLTLSMGSGHRMGRANFVHLCFQNMFITLYVPGLVLGSGSAVVNETSVAPVIMTHFRGREHRVLTS